MSKSRQWALLSDEAATLARGEALASELPERALVFLHGDLGAGKTTLVRGILRGRGFSGAVKSPTYTLLEPYELPSGAIYHFDFYRIVDPEELDFIGVAEVLAGPGLKLVEWPQQAAGRLPTPQLEVWLRDVTAADGTVAREIALEWRS
ncbi:MAG: tRNA (adenosine(37)-N6)-threonylcarbamoyltransferase complex ATPase subunit type 1 TsaE [Pseudomonadota bacterium]